MPSGASRRRRPSTPAKPKNIWHANTAREELEFVASSEGGRPVQTAKIEDFTISISIIANPDSPFRAAVRWSAPGEKHYTALWVANS